jgi:peptidoglycan endopeptidase LytF
MKVIVFYVFGLLTIGVFAQEINEEFIPIIVDKKEAFMSSKTGEYTFRAHAITDPNKLKTTASGVVYTETTIHKIKKGETLPVIAKKNGVSVSEIKTYNKVTGSNLKIGETLKIVKNLLVSSSSPIIGASDNERVIAKLSPGENPGQFVTLPTTAAVESQVIETKKSEEKPTATVYKAQTSVKNPVFGLQDSKDLEKELIIENAAETKRDKLIRLKAEVLTLEAELDKEVMVKAFNVVEEVNEVELKQEVAVNNVLIEDEVVEPETLYHTVSIEDTVSSIAKQYNMTMKSLIVLNELRSESLKIGRKLKVTSSNNETEQVNEVQAKIVKDVKQAEPKKTLVTKVVEEVKVEERKKEIVVKIVEEVEEVKEVAPKTALVVENTKEVEQESEVAVTIVKEVEALETAYHTVSMEDTVASIAKQYNMTMKSLIVLNGLRSESLKIGRKLKVTSSKIDTKEEHEVAAKIVKEVAPKKQLVTKVIEEVKVEEPKKEVVVKIVEEVEEVKEVEPKTALVVKVDKEVKEAEPKQELAVNNVVMEDKETDPEAVYHTVSIEDTVSSIAKQYNMTMKSLIVLNELRSDSLKIGSKLKVISIKD